METTPNRQYPKPVKTTFVSIDVETLRQFIEMVDSDVAMILVSLTGKAAVVHTHSIDDVNGLVSALAGKAAADHTHALDDIVGVSGTAAAPNGYVLVKQGGAIVPGDPATVLGAHNHSIAQITGLSTTLAAKLDAQGLAALAVKATPVDADTVPLTDSAAGGALKRLSWQSIKATLKSYFDGLYSAPGHTHPASAISGLIFTKSFESSQQTITSAGTLSLVHGLGGKPKLLSTSIVCVEAENGYAVGDEVVLDLGASPSTDQGIAVAPSDEAIVIRFGALAMTSLVQLNKTTGARASVTNSRWKLIVRAWA
jgi:hypothetical protein